MADTLHAATDARRELQRLTADVWRTSIMVESERLVLCSILRHADPETDEAAVTMVTIAKETGLSPYDVQRMRDVTIERGWIQSTRKPGNASLVYRIHRGRIRAFLDLWTPRQPEQLPLDLATDTDTPADRSEVVGVIADAVVEVLARIR